LAIFALGMLAAYASRLSRPAYLTMRARFPWRLVSAIAFATVCALSITWGVAGSRDRFWLLDLPTGVLAASLLAGTSWSPDGALTRMFSWRPLVFVGTFSYSLYLIHAPVLQILWQFVLQPLAMTSRGMFFFFMTLGFGIVLATAYLFFRVFEQPFMRSARATVPGPREGAPMPIA
jgi:peptidoglycan/LPS O-acetylase OafA/YrhL